MRSDLGLAILAGMLAISGCTHAPTPKVPEPAPVLDGWFADPDELCDKIRQSARSVDEAALARMEIPESLWVAATWIGSEAQRIAVDSVHERSSREFARWLHLANNRKGRLRLIQALREDSLPASGCPAFAGEPTPSGPLLLYSFADSAGQVRLAGSLARMGNSWRVHSYAEAGAKR